MDRGEAGINMEAVMILAAAVVAVLLIYWKFRKDYVAFTAMICRQLENLIAGEKIESSKLMEETLASKISCKLEQLEIVTQYARMKDKTQKEQVQKIVSDISHQLKTPIANIVMYCDTICNHELPREKERECLEIMQNQVEKLDFLVRTLIKTSRLEQELIVLKKVQINLRDCLLDVLQEAEIKAERKKLQISFLCESERPVLCDPKWTAEAIGNILDNAVKYTPDSGKITVSAEPLEMYTKVMIQDTGIGIAPEHINAIFKRFYRENKTADQEGVGIGLYLSREIITRQGGYIKVKSQEGVGTVFSIYILNA